MSGQVLVLAKVPVAGRVKTRLGQVVGFAEAADLARRALLDSIEVCAAAFGPRRCLIALDGDLAVDSANAVLTRALAGWTVFGQRGAGFAQRLVAAHRDAARAVGNRISRGLVQIGMDTPQLGVDDLLGLVAATGPRRVCLGPAADGGWWGLAHRDPACVGLLDGVAMSTPQTGRDTRAAIEAAGFWVELGPTRRDVDTLGDAHEVAALAPRTRFAEGLGRLAEGALR